MQGDGDVILVVFALVMVTLESNCEGKIRISERFDTFINTEKKIESSTLGVQSILTKFQFNLSGKCNEILS